MPDKDHSDTIYIRELGSDDWEALRDIRLKALKMHPGFYCSTYEDTKKLPEEEWRGRLASPDNAIFGLFDGDKVVGITGIYLSTEEPDQAALVMSFIEPAYRGRGFSYGLYEARINWAKQQNNVKKIIVSHREDNEPSSKAILKNGFEYVGEDERTWPDGITMSEKKYVLDLGKLQSPVD